MRRYGNAEGWLTGAAPFTVGAILCFSTLVSPSSAQVISIGVRPPEAPAASSAPKPRLAAGSNKLASAPVFGYVQGPEVTELRAISGKPNTPQLTADVTLPGTAKRVELAPRGFYALLEDATDGSVSVWALGGGTDDLVSERVEKLQALTTRPDLIVFSPRGSTAALYTDNTRTLRVIQNLPAEPSPTADVSFADVGSPSRIAVSDDAAVVVASFADGRLLVHRKESEWRSLPAVFSPTAWSFVPNTHDLIISDIAQKAIAVFPAVDSSSGLFRSLATNVNADRVALTKDGVHVLAAQVGGNRVWTIDVRDGSIAEHQEQAPVESITPLRDGFSFLLSTSPAVSIVKVKTSPAVADLTTSPEISRN